MISFLTFFSKLSNPSLTYLLIQLLTNYCLEVSRFVAIGR